ncbi:MAG TPA: tRNA (adenosine(37)-N6)-dimethylallyltransferase MiaA [Anaerolineales bacterium]|nr:tRNA (adenosine(37)-N6)-dimethylallyltransferase MiaA [Anaerolineales bacterium]
MTRLASPILKMPSPRRWETEAEGLVTILDAGASESGSTDARPLVVMLVGPTAVGKTDVSLQLARALDAEIVSVDSRLFYRGMDVGTAKPTPDERKQIPHHLIDLVEPDETLSLADFRMHAQRAIEGIISRGRLPLLVGGTGQYIQAVRSGWNPPAVSANERLRNELQRLAVARGTAWLHERLAAMDPESAHKIDSRNLRRTIRAMEVTMLTGRRFSEQRGTGETMYRILSIGLRRSRSELYARIDARIDSMLQRGMLEETRRLLARGLAPSLPAFSAIGYSQCIQVLHGEMDLREARMLMQRRTREFVRRQSTWFKESDPGIQWFDAARPDLIEAVSTLINQARSDTIVTTKPAGAV